MKSFIIALGLAVGLSFANTDSTGVQKQDLKHKWEQLSKEEKQAKISELKAKKQEMKESRKELKEKIKSLTQEQKEELKVLRQERIQKKEQKEKDTSAS